MAALSRTGFSLWGFDFFLFGTGHRLKPVLPRRQGIPIGRGPKLSDALRSDLHASSHFFTRFYLAEAERPVQRLDGFLHAARFHQEGNVVRRGTLRDGDHVNPFVTHGAEDAAGNSGSSSHVFSY